MGRDALITIFLAVVSTVGSACYVVGGVQKQVDMNEKTLTKLQTDFGTLEGKQRARLDELFKAINRMQGRVNGIQHRLANPAGKQTNP